MAHPVRNNPSQNRFELETEAGLAVADYRLADGAMTIFHTHVPVVLRQRGVGSCLVRAALEDARSRGLKVIAQCWFVSDFLKRHPEFNDLAR